MPRLALSFLALALLVAPATSQTPTLAEPVEAAVEAAPAEVAEAVVVESHATVAPGPVCCPIRVVDVRTKLSARRAYRCYGPGVNTAACVDNPADCTCTLYEVPLCVPRCCVGEPRVCNARTGLLGRGHVDLVWDCGFVATVTFRVHGGVIITYAG